MMRRQDLVFYPQIRRRHGFAWLLLLSGCWALLHATSSWLDLNSQIEQRAHERQVAAELLRGPKMVQAQQLNPVVQAELDHVRAWQAAQPGSALQGLRAIEQLRLEKILLLALAPDPEGRRIDISGEAANWPALENLLRELQQLPASRLVQLLRHDVASDDPTRQALRFAIAVELAP